MSKSVEDEFKNAIYSSNKGDLDAWLEVNNEAEVKAAVIKFAGDAVSALSIQQEVDVWELVDALNIANDLIKTTNGQSAFSNAIDLIIVKYTQTQKDSK